ncbi:MAG TPA: LysR family transcriptional regulator [Rhodopila sp.]|jgi:DNA-binding transcriptional LysR family regulator|nr:LysR family transcriptional regulator [Rhodopila sp.]
MSQVVMHGQSAAECREKVREASVSTEMEASGTHRGILDFNLMVLFDAMMQERNLTRAASRLGLSQSAGSHALARLRQVLHDDLFVRGPDGMHPTPRAEQIAGPWREALRMLRMTLEPDTFDPSTTTRSFVVGVDSYAARAVVPSLARTVGTLSPRARLDVRPIGGLNILDQLDAGAMDVALSKLIDGGERFKCIRVMDDDYVALIDRDHPAANGPVANGPVMSIEDVARIPHIAISSGNDDTGFVDDVLEQHGFTRQIAIQAPLLSLVLMLIGSNRLAVVPRRVAIGLAQICPLAVKELPFPSPRISLSMIWHRRLDNHAAHRWLRDRIREAAQVLAAD